MTNIIVTVAAFVSLIWLFHVSAKHEWEERNWWENPNDNDPFNN